MLHMRQHIANKAERTFLVWVYARGTHAHRGFVRRVSSTRLPLSSAQNATLSFISLRLEPRVVLENNNEHLTRLSAEGLPLFRSLRESLHA